MRRQRCLRDSRIAAPGLAVVFIEIPASAFRGAVGADQHAGGAAHVPVERLHGPAPTRAEEPGQFVARGVEVLAVDLRHGHPSAAREVEENPVHAPFVGHLVLQRRGLIVPEQELEVGGERLAIVRMVQREVVDAVSVAPQPARKVAHGSEDRDDFLGVVHHIVGFLAHLHEDMDDVGVLPGEPAVQGIELVAEHESERGHCGSVILNSI